MKTPLCLLFCLVAAHAGVASPDRPIESENYYERLNKPGESDVALAKSIRAELDRGRVPTGEAASKLAMQAYPGKPGLHLMRRFMIGGLYRLGSDLPEFGSVGDLVWEVRVLQEDGGISNVIWVSCSSAVSRSLFP